MLSQVLDNAKKFVLYVLTPIAFIAGYITYLLGQKKTLENELQEARFEGKDKERANEQEKLDEEISSTVSDYESAKRAHFGPGE